MTNRIVVGAQWGDEGKGKVTDSMAREADVVARFGGGNNAGHTVIVDDDKFELHQVPSGILYPEKLCVLGNGVVLDPEELVAEMEGLEERNISLDNFYISDTAHLIMPYHRMLDRLEEERKGSGKIGTTGKGIGPAYTDKVARRGIRVGDFLDKQKLREKLTKALDYQNLVLQEVYGSEPLSVEGIISDYQPCFDKLSSHIVDTTVLLGQARKEGKSIFFEGAQGTLLDIDYGSYPYVTSSNPTAGGVCTGAGIGPTEIDQVIGVAKAYVTRVGEGPFPTELENEIGEFLREKGHEFGVTTGRPRRCGWLDIPLLRHAVRVNSFTDIALTKLDVLSGLDQIKVCTGYKIQGEIVEDISDVEEEYQPVYETYPGWEEDITEVRDFSDLPQNARDYVTSIEDMIETRISVIGVGPDREEAIYREV
ncbi:MAG: adenylosuccinate synthase [Halanaerobiaceae bacterium]